MAISFPTLFGALGSVAGTLKNGHTFAGGGGTGHLDASIDDISNTFIAAGAPDVTDLSGVVVGNKKTYQLAVTNTLGPGLRTLFQAYVRRIVNTTFPQSDSTSSSLALKQLIAEMIVQGYRVSACTVTAAATPGTNVGNGVVLMTTKRGDGSTQDNLFAENGILTCTGDTQNGTATSGSEPWLYRGDEAPTSDLGFDWPGASGANTGYTTVDSQAAGGLSLLAGGNFDTYTVANIPDGWAVGVGTPGTHIFSEGTSKYRGANALKFLGDGATKPSIRQTLTNLKPNRVYGLNLFARSGGVLTTADSLTLSLVDGSNNVISDDKGNAVRFAVALSALTTTYASVKGSFYTPKTLPAVVKLQIETSPAVNLVTGEAVYIDEAALVEMAPLYSGGPYMAAFAGSVPFMTNDTFAVATTNNHNGATFGATWQRVFDRMFGMRSLGLLLPTTGATLLNDSLIVAS
jgi:hypothetical protein